MERRLLARSRFFSNVLTDVDELLQNRYSRTGSQKSYLVLKPTGIQNEESAKDDLLETKTIGEEEQDTTPLRKQQAGKAGKLDPTVNWSALTNKKMNTKKIRKRLNKCNSKQEKRQLKAEISQGLLKSVKRSYEALQDKKNKKTSRLAFRAYVQANMQRQLSAATRIKKLVSGGAFNDKELLTSIQEILTKNKIIQYSQYSNLYELWIKYIQDLLQTKRNGMGQNARTILTKLATAELVGLVVRVVESSDKTLKNLVGLVLHEYKNFLVVIVPNGLKSGESISLAEQNRLLGLYVDGQISENGECLFTPRELIGGIRMVEKKSCVFKILVPFKDFQDEDSMDVDGQKMILQANNDIMEFLIVGARINFRSSERSSRKLKDHNVKDLEVLLEASGAKI